MTVRRSVLAFGSCAVLAAGGIVAAPTFASADPTARTLTVTARNETSSLFIPCRTCVQQSQPAGAHIGGTEIDAGSLYDQAGRFATAATASQPKTPPVHTKR